MLNPFYTRRVVVLPCLTTLFCVLAVGAAPVVHWTFDVTGNEVRDVAGNSHGMLEGDTLPERTWPGVFGAALRFDAGRSRVRVPHSDEVSLHGEFTVEYVIKPSRIDGFRTLFWKGDRTVSPQAINYYVDLRDGRPELKAKDAAGRWIVYSTPTVLSANEWHHVVITFRSGKVEIFVNGKGCDVSASEDGERSKELLGNTCDLVLGDGANPSGTAYSFCGLIDDLKIYGSRDIGMLGEDYAMRWRAFRKNVRERETAFQQERAQRAVEARKNREREYDALLAERASQPGAPFVATVLPTTERLNGAPDFFRSIRRFTRTATVSAARRESEGFQVILMGHRNAETVKASVSVSDLVCDDGARIPASALSWGRLERVSTEEPDLPVAFVGAIPDVIIEDGALVSVPPGDFGALFCRIHTGDASPGRYEGKLTLSAGKFRETIDIDLTVYDFALPVRGTLRTAFCFFEQYYLKWYGLKALTDPQREAIYEFLLDYRLSPCNIYSSTAPFPEVRFLEKYRDRINFFTVGRIRGGTAEEIGRSVAERVALFRRIRELGLEEYMYFYSFDELSGNMKRFPAAVKITSALRKAWPELKMMQTSFPIPELQPLFNVWAPLFYEFDKADKLAVLQTMRARGDRIWWYAADAPRHPFPNFFLDYPVYDCRVIGTLSYVQGVEGILYWCANREWQTNLDIREQWPDAPWKSHIFSVNTGRRKYKNGMGNLIYPGRNGVLCASLRLENLRDGLEDYEYLHALGGAVKRLEGAGVPAAAKALLPEARALLTPPPTAVKGIHSWSQDPTHLLQYRDRVGRMLGKIAEAMRP
ncbi:MAG: DUF4091 domain-containing protein [Lentisphaeria bacterium]|nr:DUF4091 domain-containing protein [Lentisphaeria bacterium]